MICGGILRKQISIMTWTTGLNRSLTASIVPVTFFPQLFSIRKDCMQRHVAVKRKGAATLLFELWVYNISTFWKALSRYCCSFVSQPFMIKWSDTPSTEKCLKYKHLDWNDSSPCNWILSGTDGGVRFTNPTEWPCIHWFGSVVEFVHMFITHLVMWSCRYVNVTLARFGMI